MALFGDIKKIVEFLNSDNSETVIIGLQYLRDSDIKIPKKAFKKGEKKNIKEACDEIIHHIIYNVNDIYWKMLLDMLISKIITYSFASFACNFIEYKFKVLVIFNRNN